MMERLPTLKEEIDRKALEACEAILNRLKRRQINQAQASEAALALFNALCGLVDKDIMDIICAVQDEVAGGYVERQVLLNGSNVAVIEWEVGSAAVRFTTNPVGGVWLVDKKVAFADELQPSEAAADKVEAIVASLQSKGWRLV